MDHHRLTSSDQPIQINWVLRSQHIKEPRCWSLDLPPSRFNDRSQNVLALFLHEIHRKHRQVKELELVAEDIVLYKVEGEVPVQRTSTADWTNGVSLTLIQPATTLFSILNDIVKSRDVVHLVVGIISQRMQTDSAAPGPERSHPRQFQFGSHGRTAISSTSSPIGTMARHARPPAGLGDLTW